MTQEQWFQGPGLRLLPLKISCYLIQPTRLCHKVKQANSPCYTNSSAFSLCGLHQPHKFQHNQNLLQQTIFQILLITATLLCLLANSTCGAMSTLTGVG